MKQSMMLNFLGCGLLITVPVILASIIPCPKNCRSVLLTAILLTCFLAFVVTKKILKLNAKKQGESP